MYHGKYQKPAAAKTGRRKPGILIISLVLLFTMVIGGTAAYLKGTTNSVENTFKPGSVEISIDEKTTHSTKSNITFVNTKTATAIPVYIRATLVIFWTDVINGEEQIIAPPANCSVTGGDPANGWFKVGDIYYYPDAVDPGEATAVMADVITVNIPEGSTVKCYIDVRAESIQTQPETVVSRVWTDVKVSDGKLQAS